MHVNKYLLGYWLMSYRNTLADEISTISDIADTKDKDYIDIIEGNRELIHSINRVLEGKEELTIDKDLNFKEQ